MVQQHIEYDFLVSVQGKGETFCFDRLHSYDQCDLIHHECMYFQAEIQSTGNVTYGLELRIWLDEPLWIENEEVSDKIADHIMKYVEHILIPTDFYAGKFVN